MTSEGAWRLSRTCLVLVALMHSCHALQALERIATALERPQSLSGRCSSSAAGATSSSDRVE